MSNVITKRLEIGQHTAVEHMPNGAPIGAPVRFEYFRNGCYLTIDQAEALGRELAWAAEKAREVAVVFARAEGERAVRKRRAEAERLAITEAAPHVPVYDAPSFTPDPSPTPSYDSPAASPDPTPSYDGGGGDFGGGGATGDF